MKQIHFFNLLMIFFIPQAVHSQAAESPQLSKQQSPDIHYILSANSADPTRIKIEMRLDDVSPEFQLAMAAHPEYDDRFWRYVQKLSVSTEAGPGIISRKDSSLWNVSVPARKAVISYEIILPLFEAHQRGAWQPFLSKQGGLVGELHSFMFIPGKTRQAVDVELNLPEGWDVACALDKKDKTSNLFSASSFDELADAPMLIGKFHSWEYAVDGIAHTVCYFSENRISFDSLKFTGQIKKITEACRNLFGSLPYKKYFFLLQDECYGGLEHANSLPLGAPAADLAENPADILSEIAHEYFHSWNLVRIKPAEWKVVDYKTPALSKVLWWSEGLTLFYADLLLRRAHLPVHDSLRKDHLEALFNDYYRNAGNEMFAAEKISEAANGPNGMLGDFVASTHTQGELIGTILDIAIRNKTNGRRSIDDVMRKLMTDFGDKKGIHSADIGAAIVSTSGLDVSGFFSDHIYGNKKIDFNKYLKPAGLTLTVVADSVRDEKGNIKPDIQLYTYRNPNEKERRIQILNPAGCWTKAGIHTGDVLLSLNSKTVNNNRELFALLSALHTGDMISVVIKRNNKPLPLSFMLTGYTARTAKLRINENSTAAQNKLYREWADAESTMRN